MPGRFGRGVQVKIGDISRRPSFGAHQSPDICPRNGTGTTPWSRILKTAPRYWYWPHGNLLGGKQIADGSPHAPAETTRRNLFVIGADDGVAHRHFGGITPYGGAAPSAPSVKSHWQSGVVIDSAALGSSRS